MLGKTKKQQTPKNGNIANQTQKYQAKQKQGGQAKQIGQT